MRQETCFRAVRASMRPSFRASRTFLHTISWKVLDISSQTISTGAIWDSEKRFTFWNKKGQSSRSQHWCILEQLGWMLQLLWVKSQRSRSQNDQRHSGRRHRSTELDAAVCRVCIFSKIWYGIGLKLVFFVHFLMQTVFYLLFTIPLTTNILPML